jgi:hypothetical protein
MVELVARVRPRVLLVVQLRALVVVAVVHFQAVPEQAAQAAAETHKLQEQQRQVVVAVVQWQTEVLAQLAVKA